MKKRIMVTVVCVGLAIAAYFVGKANGVRHAIEDSEIYTVTRYNPDEPDSSAWEKYDQQIFIDLDGQTYVHGMYQG